jgi:hypothetical protein
MKTSPRFLLPVCALLGLLLAGCASRSISDSGYRGSGWYGHNHGSRAYTGELSEFDVLGIQRGADITEEQIVKILEASAAVKLRRGSKLLLIQSGAAQPDEPMRRALEQQFSVVPFSGQPPRTNADTYAKSLRLAAAEAGCEHIICYWGVLESAKKGMGTKTISWVPIVGLIVPDEKQQMRIRLKLAVIDVRGGRWTMFAPESFENRAWSEKLGREAADQGQVEKLKKLAYEAAAGDLVKMYAN